MQFFRDFPAFYVLEVRQRLCLRDLYHLKETVDKIPYLLNLQREDPVVDTVIQRLPLWLLLIGALKTVSLHTPRKADMLLHADLCTADQLIILLLLHQHAHKGFIRHYFQDLVFDTVIVKLFHKIRTKSGTVHVVDPADLVLDSFITGHRRVHRQISTLGMASQIKSEIPLPGKPPRHLVHILCAPELCADRRAVRHIKIFFPSDQRVICPPERYECITISKQKCHRAKLCSLVSIHLLHQIIRFCIPVPARESRFVKKLPVFLQFPLHRYKIVPVHPLRHIAQCHCRLVFIQPRNDPSENKIGKMREDQSVNLTKGLFRKGKAPKFIYI